MRLRRERWRYLLDRIRTQPDIDEMVNEFADLIDGLLADNARLREALERIGSQVVVYVTPKGQNALRPMDRTDVEEIVREALEGKDA